MPKRVSKPFDNFILFSNGSISEVMFIDKKNIREINGVFYYHTTEVFKGKVKYKAVAMSDNKEELEKLGSENGLL